ncbi:MAG: aldehyde dehydrogenase [Gammaproteobacteria bacterium]|nr:aldehyde dehydrogenase [Gammaproteobacteria bacterium]MCW5584255.1 aldehyde dehydrogenase [Gammaproteobacteria bacterium]
MKIMLDKQRQFFASGSTLPIKFRIEQLNKLKILLQQHESEITEALKKDLNKIEMEAVVTEIIFVAKEIEFIIKNLPKWAKPTKVSSPFPLCWPGRSAIHYEPYGSVLIIGPWNYPFMLVMSPLVGAICAGNCAVVKPSEIASYTQDVLTKLINNYFSPEYIVAIKGGHQEVSQLLKEKFDYIFYTGGTQVGKIIMQAAAEQLTPVTLELGGKSPCIVDETIDFSFAARRIMWAKLLNAGQTCLAPDYILVHQTCKAALIKELKVAATLFYSDDPANHASYGRIINKKHFERIIKLMQKGNILLGGKANETDLYISPTLIDGVDWSDSIMQEEIFGPILPILTYENMDEVIQTINTHPKPLSLYLFTKNKNTEHSILNRVTFGGGCINDCLLHIVNYHLPFGGVGASGIGAYHGKYSFETFSHRKSIYKKRFLLDFSIQYPPYTETKLTWFKRLMSLSLRL